MTSEEKAMELLKETYSRKIYGGESILTGCVFEDRDYGPCLGIVECIDEISFGLDNVYIPVHACDAHRDMHENGMSSTLDLVVEGVK
jgi:hypothetical protein